MSSTPWRKCRRTTTEQASPRGARKSRIQDLFGTTSSSSDSASPPRRRRRHGFRKMVKKMVQPRSSSIAPDHIEPGYMPKEYVGVRYRVELNKYVTEIRPTKSTKKIWLGTYDTAEEAARAFDIGNLCCKKNLPLNFQDSPRMLRKISSRLSPDETRNAIAKLAKEVARVVVINVSPSETTKRKEVDRAAAQKAHDLVQQKSHESGQSELQELQEMREMQELRELQELDYSDGRQAASRTQHFETGASAAITYTETIPETQYVVEESDLVATSMPLIAGCEGGSGGSFDAAQAFFDDDRAHVPLHKLINFGPDQSRPY